MFMTAVEKKERLVGFAVVRQPGPVKKLGPVPARDGALNRLHFFPIPRPPFAVRLRSLVSPPRARENFAAPPRPSALCTASAAGALSARREMFPANNRARL